MHFQVWAYVCVNVSCNAHAYGGPKLPRGIFLNQYALFIGQILACQLAMMISCVCLLNAAVTQKAPFLFEFWWVLKVRTLVLTLVPSLQLLHMYL